MKIILITNGSGGCGKDTMAQIMAKYVHIKKVSSIDVIKNMLKDYTVSYTTSHGKNERYRKLLATVKQAFIDFDDLPFNEMVHEIIEFAQSKNQVLLMDIREPEEIEKIVRAIKNFKTEDYLNHIDMKDIKLKTVLVINDNVPIIETVNSDKEVFEYAPYDYVVDNSGTLSVLEDSVITLLTDLGFDVKTNEIRDID